MNENKVNQYLPLLTMLYMTVVFTVSVLSNKIIVIAGHITMAGTLFIPFWFVLSDIITEIYGYKLSWQIIWFAFLCLFIFSILCNIELHTNFPSFWHGQSAYELVLGNLMRLTTSGVVAYVISGTINIYLLSKWKFILKGRCFWLRSLFASTIGEFAYTVIAVIMIQYHILTWTEIEKIIITSYTIKTICTLLSMLPASLVVSFLKRNETPTCEEENINPFNQTEII